MFERGACGMESILTGEQWAAAAALRHQLHRRPELSGREEGTLAALTAFLEEHTSFTPERRGQWFYAYREGVGQPIAFRAEMDALPMTEGGALPYASQNKGAAHKCGHDGHCAALCALAMAVENGAVKRPVYLIFETGEEIGLGGELCAPLLAEKGIREVYAFHNLSGYPMGAVVYRRGLTQPASEGLSLQLRGTPSHASAPEEGKNPAPEIARLTLSAQGLNRRDGAEMKMCTVTGVKVGSGDFGISPGEGELRVTLRAEKESAMKDMEVALVNEARSLAEKAGLQMQYRLWDVFPETRNDDACLDKVISAAGRLGIQAVEMADIWRASEDFGHLLKACPGALFYIGTGEGHAPVHTDGYDFPDEILSVAVNMFVELAKG